MKNAELKEEENKRTFWQRFPKQSLWRLWWMTCGYGTEILWIIGWCVIFVLLFTLIYYAKGDLVRAEHPATEQEFTFKQRFLEFPKQYLTLTDPLGKKENKKTGNSFISALRFSSVILLKIGYRDTTITGKILGINYKYVVWTEWALGYYMLASLVVTLTNTVPVVNRLLTGVF